ncbi:DNA glycosylase/AP lyase ROS1 [Dioscorea cayenensis subsp. rotundata]|uniref:DNA glycosylase/AP lyase ROS1 n=1 Tax=Dioscorea cayennensis subsp. rotundata TaxID=55577 RepID=A0AB40BNB3_DIOCR|nr:DNA glycosylase/AP lyase ROS1 [Dioscorea cayenensis subsp. rotundata]
MDEQEENDEYRYLFAIWKPGENAESSEPPINHCSFQGFDELCNNMACFRCNGLREAKSETVRGTLLIPCRTAMRGRFPLNGTYFQVNEVFADNKSSKDPIVVPRNWLWNLPRKICYFGTGISTIFRGLTMEEIQFCMGQGTVCIRGFDRETRRVELLYKKITCSCKSTRFGLHGNSV